MNSSDHLPPKLRFDAFEIDVHSGELLKDGNKIRLQRQPFALLAMLLEHPGELVTRDELRQKIWPEETFVDFDLALNTAVKKIRAALGVGIGLSAAWSYNTPPSHKCRSHCGREREGIGCSLRWPHWLCLQQQ